MSASSRHWNSKDERTCELLLFQGYQLEQAARHAGVLYVALVELSDGHARLDDIWSNARMSQKVPDISWQGHRRRHQDLCCPQLHTERTPTGQGLPQMRRPNSNFTSKMCHEDLPRRLFSEHCVLCNIAHRCTMHSVSKCLVQFHVCTILV